MKIDYRLPLMIGIDIPIPELQLTVHSPVIRDIAFMGEESFFSAVQYLCLDKEYLIQDETLLSSLTNFQVLMKVLGQSQDKQKKEQIKTLLLLLFPRHTSVILPSSIILSAEGSDPIAIDDNNFDIFQNCIKQVLCVNNIFQGDNVIYNPANAAAKEIADTLMRGRRKVSQMKSNKNGGNESILTRYVSILKIAGAISSFEEAASLNLFQLFDLMERYTAFVEWDNDLRVRLAGGKPDKTVETWTRDLHVQNKINKPTSVVESPGSSKGAAFYNGTWTKS